MFKKIKKFLLKFSLFNSFYIIKKIYLGKKKKFFYSEFGEDIFISRFFQKKKIGRYIDVGAYHPIKSSLTYFLYKKGWKGMNLDLSRKSIDLFIHARPEDINLNLAVSDTNKDTFYFENSEIHQQNSLIKTSENQIKKNITSCTLDSLQKKYHFYDVNYLNIDTEGTEIKVLHGIDFQKTYPELITIEDNSFDMNSISKKEKINFLSSKGYSLINQIGVTLFFCKSNLVDEVFDYIKID